MLPLTLFGGVCTGLSVGEKVYLENFVAVFVLNLVRSYHALPLLGIPCSKIKLTGFVAAPDLMLLMMSAPTLIHILLIPCCCIRSYRL